MLHFEIKINGRTIKRFEAVNTGSVLEGEHLYDITKIDMESGCTTEYKLLHDRSEGAEALVRKMIR